MKLSTLLGELEKNGKVKVTGNLDIDISGLSTDSRMVGKGSLFAALTGGLHDGHDFLAMASARGASAFLVDRARAAGSRQTGDAAVVETDDVRGVLAGLAARFYGYPAKKLDLVGITGTNGKTTVTYLLESIFEAARRKPGVIGTIEYRWGGKVSTALSTTPEAVELQKVLAGMVDDGVEAVAMEVSSHALSLSRTGGCRFEVAVFTNLSRDHLDFHDDEEEYFRAKSLLFGPGNSRRAVVNVDDPWGARLRRSLDIEVIGFGESENAEVSVRDVCEDSDGLRFTVVTAHEEFEVRSPLLGRHNVSNILAAASAAMALGIEHEAIAAGVGCMELVPGRFEKVSRKGEPLVLVDYAHTPDALKNALGAARRLTEGRLILVFGCGGDRDRGKRPLMGEAASAAADLTILTSDNPRNEKPGEILREIEEGFHGGAEAAGKLMVIEDRRLAIQKAVKCASMDDLVLIAGKGHEDYQIAQGLTKPFSDRKEAMAALRERSR